MVISSRKQKNVESAVNSLRNDGIAVEGVVCHVANAEQRKTLFETVQTHVLSLTKNDSETLYA